MSLLAAGRITAYEANKVLKQGKERRRVWITEVPGSRGKHVLAVLMNEDVPDHVFVGLPDENPLDPVIGSTDARLIVDRVSSDVHGALGYRAESLVGTSLLALIVPGQVPDVLTALAETARQEGGVSLRVGILRADLVPVTCLLVLLPLAPVPSCAFALLLEAPDAPPDGRTITTLITRLGQGVRGAVASASAVTAPLRSDVDLTGLSGRELEIVTLLAAGDRVTSIAKRLFLSEGTVRNNLSSVFRKLDVAGQQELIALVRPGPPQV